MSDYRDLIGVKYTPHGRSIEEGFDCYGIGIEVLKRDNIVLPDVFKGNLSNAENLRYALKEIPHETLENPQKNCIIELSVYGDPCHIAIYIGEGLIIHSTYKYGVRIQPLHIYSTRIRGIYKVKNNSL